MRVNQGAECRLALEWSCADSGAETIITLDDGTRATMSAAAPELNVRMGSDRRPEETMTSQRRINWLSGAQSGGLVVEYTERAFSGCGDQEEPIFGDSSCAAMPTQQPAAPLAALLPMLLGALLWRRRAIMR